MSVCQTAGVRVCHGHMDIIIVSSCNANGQYYYGFLYFKDQFYMEVALVYTPNEKDLFHHKIMVPLIHIPSNPSITL